MSDLYASLAPVRLNDGTADANNAAVMDSAPAGTEYALVVRAIMPTSTTVDTELPAAASLADATANPTVPGIGAYLMGFNGTTWDRVVTANTGRLQVDVVTGAASSDALLDNSAFTDGTSPVTPVGFIFDEVAGISLTEDDVAAARIDAKRAIVGVIEDATTRGQRLAVSAAGAASMDLSTVGGTAVGLGATTASASIPVTLASDEAALPVTDDGGSLTVDAPVTTPVFVSLSDGAAALVGQKAMAASVPVVFASDQSALAVDIGVPANGLPIGYDLIGLYGTHSALAAAGTVSVVTNTPADTKPFFIRTVRVVASGQTRWQVKFGSTVLDTGFNPQEVLSQTVFYDPPLTGTGDAATALTVDVENRELSAMDVYAALRGWVLA